MDRLKGFGYVFIFIYVIVSFFSGLFFHGQSRVKCIEQHGFWMGGIVGCDVIEGNLSPTALPSFLTSQLKGLFWPYHFFFDIKDSEMPVSSNSPASEYPFEKTVEQQASNEFIKAYARCDVLLTVTAEGVKRSNESLHRKLIGSANSSKHMAESLLLANKYSYIDAGTALSSDMKRELIEEVTTEVHKYTNHYIKLYDDLGTESVNMLKQGRVYSESAQKTYQEDVTNCLELSGISNPQPKPLTELLDILPEPPPQPKIIGDILEQYPYKLSLVEIRSELTNEAMKETVMRCGGILQAFVNGVPNEGTKIPEPVERFAALYLTAISTHKEKLGVANRVMAEFKKHEESYTPWLKYKKIVLNDKNKSEADIMLSLLDDESQCLDLTNSIYNIADQN